MNRRIPAEVFPPGEFLRDEMEERGWTQTELAEILGRPFRLVNELLSGKKSITPETAIGLGEAFGTDPQVWLNLESAYRLWLARSASDSGEVTRRASLYNRFPIKEMIKRHWIAGSSVIDQLEDQVKEFFELDRIDDEPVFSANARKSTPYGVDHTPAQKAWLNRVKRLAPVIQAPAYDPSKFEQLKLRLRNLIASDERVAQVPRVLGQFGIRFVVVEHLPGTRIDGAAFWLNEQSPVIALSLRYDRIDWFWHSLAHELGHIFYRDGDVGEAPSLDDDLFSDRSSGDEQRPEVETRADEFACTLLVPREEIDSFIARIRPLYSKTRIIQFANRLQVHPGIIIGQLQRRGEIKYSQNREMLVKIRSKVIETTLTDGWGHVPGL